MSNMQEGDQENVKLHCNKHKSFTSVYFSKRFTKKEDSSHAKQLGKIDILFPNILQTIINPSQNHKISRKLNIEILYDFRIESRAIESM